MSLSTTEASRQHTSIAAKAVALVARPVVESAKMGLMCSAASPCAKAKQLSLTRRGQEGVTAFYHVHMASLQITDLICHMLSKAQLLAALGHV